MQSHDQEAPEQDLSRMTATHDRHDPENDHETGIRVAYAPRHPQITHACATQLPMCTCGRSWGGGMLSLAKAHKDYYLEKVGEVSPREAYYLKGAAASGRWHGSGAADLGLEGVVSAEGLVRLFDGEHPETGEQLGHRLRKDGVVLAGHLRFESC